jgi:NAD(P)-dependent dehydrogenase (short-subunit alcohol dehydrogenase family)
MAEPDSGASISLITGANKGIGYATAYALGLLGHTVLVGSRDLDRGLQAVSLLRDQGVDARAVTLATTDDESVAAAARWIEDTFGRLDVLVNNAGIKLEDSPAPPTASSVNLVRETYETNVFAAIRVTLAMLPPW